MTSQLIKKILPMFTLSVATCSIPAAYSAVLPDVHLHAYEAAETDDVATMHDKWLAGAASAAKQFGCTKVAVEQQPNETITDAVKLFGLVATEGSCLVLAPVSTNLRSTRYSFANGGKLNGIDVLYISDLPRPRIWKGNSLGN